MLSRNRVSPATSLFSAGIHTLMLPWVCPGVSSTWNSAGPSFTTVAFARVHIDAGLLGRGHAQPTGLHIDVIV